MIIMNLKLDKILAFNNFEINFSYPQKINNSVIKNEFLKDFPNFRYKKLNIFLGSNAAGKTSLIRVMWYILYFIVFKEKYYINPIFSDINGRIEMDFVENLDDIKALFRMKIKRDNNNLDNILIAISYLPLKKDDSYEKIVKKLDNIEYEYTDYITALEKYHFNYSYRAMLPATENGFDEVKLITNFKNKNEKDDYLDILNRVFTSFDSSIKKVVYSKDAIDAIVLEHENTPNIVIQNKNKLANIPYLSSGTKYCVNISNMLFDAKRKENAVFMIDEQFSYVSSDLEKAILSKMISLLNDESQIFYTSHNAEVSELNLPFHSLYFLKKKQINNRKYIEVLCASEVENRNNVSARSIIDNDVFSIVPDLNKIFDIGAKNE